MHKHASTFPRAVPPLQNEGDLALIEAMESSVRFYCRGTPIVFKKAHGSEIFDENGSRYIDFLSAAGSLNYGHNDPPLMRVLLDYLASEGVLQALDFATTAKAQFLRRFKEVVLNPRGLEYKIQFTGPTGTNAVEAAIKLARKFTGRRGVAAFTNAYHGVSLGALALTGNLSKRQASAVSLPDVLRLPFEGYMGPEFDTAAFARKLFGDPSSGYEPPAAFIVEVVQGEGGLQAASSEWIQAIAALARDLGALFIVDDIQTGCGRTGTFFSFEPSGVVPDIVCVSKSISGVGLPMAINLIRPEFDVWEPGEHNGTFRGNNLAFVGARAALTYWESDKFEAGIHSRTSAIRDALGRAAQAFPAGWARVVGRGMLTGLRFDAAEYAELMRTGLMRRGVIAETCGPHDEVLKLMPALNIPMPLLLEGLDQTVAAANELHHLLGQSKTA